MLSRSVQQGHSTRGILFSLFPGGFAGVHELRYLETINTSSKEPWFKVHPSLHLPDTPHNAAEAVAEL